jgi:hypothetical protein
MDKPGNPAKFSPEMRERAVRMVFEHRHEYSSQCQHPQGDAPPRRHRAGDRPPEGRAT